MMKKKLIVSLACSFCPAIMAYDVGLTSSRLLSAVASERNHQGEDNFVFSPYSILGVFHMAQLGAEGETKKEMDMLVPFDESFRMPSFDLPSEDGSQLVQVETANRIYAHKALEGNPIFEKFDKNVRLAMKAEARPLDFADSEAAAREINEFVKTTTRGHISNLVDPSSLSEMTRMVLVNALYFKAPWGSQFEPEATKEGVFYAQSARGVEEQRVLFMKQKFERGFTYLKENGVTAFAINYFDYRLRMYVYLPDDLEAFEAKLAAEPEFLEQMAARLKDAFLFENDLVLSIPKFKLSAENNKLDLVEIFKQLGVGRMFNRSEADFSGMSGTRDLFVSTYVHQADIEVNEEGTEASAATAMGIMLMSMPMQKTPLPVIVDKPFYFQVRVEEDGRTPYVLFAGRIANAAAAQ